MAAHTVIAEVGQLLSDKKNWTQGTLARRKNGKPAPPPGGQAWDCIGAVYHVLHVSLRDEGINGRLNLHAAVCAHIQEAASILHKCSAERVNDELGHAAMMHMLRVAYTRAKAGHELQAANVTRGNHAKVQGLRDHDLSGRVSR